MYCKQSFNSKGKVCLSVYWGGGVLLLEWMGRAVYTRGAWIGMDVEGRQMSLVHTGWQWQGRGGGVVNEFEGDKRRHLSLQLSQVNHMLNMYITYKMHHVSTTKLQLHIYSKDSGKKKCKRNNVTQPRIDYPIVKQSYFFYKQSKKKRQQLEQDNMISLAITYPESLECCECDFTYIW